MGPQAQPAQQPLGTPAWWGPLWVPRRLCPLPECLAILVSRPAIRRSAEVRGHGVKGQRSGSLQGQGSVLVQGSVQGQGSLRAVGLSFRPRTVSLMGVCPCSQWSALLGLKVCLRLREGLN